MWYKAKTGDEDLIKSYCANEKHKNTFILADIENFGFSNQFQDVWYEMTEGKPIGVVLKYYQTLICYSKDNSKFDLIPAIIRNHDIDTIQGDIETIQIVSDIIYGYSEAKLLPLYACFSETLNDISIVVQRAKEDDALEIAEAYTSYPNLMMLYSSDLQERAKQIAARIRSGEGIHAFVKENGQIIAHGNTTAQNTYTGMIGGLFANKENLTEQIIAYLRNYLIDNNRQPCLFNNDDELLPILKKLEFNQVGVWGVIRRIQ